MAWRHLSPGDKHDIGVALTRFGPPERTAGLWYEAGDTEAGTFATDIAEALREAKISTAPPGNTR